MGVVCLAVGCTRQVYVPVERCVRDTVREVRERVDSFMARDSVYIASRGDTTVKEVYRWRLKTRTRVDTIYKTRVDTVKVAAPVTKVKTAKEKESLVSRVATWITRGTRILIGAVALVLLVKWLVRRRRAS